MSKKQKEKLKKTFKAKGGVKQISTNPFSKKKFVRTGVKLEKDLFKVMNDHLTEIMKEERKDE